MFYEGGAGLHLITEIRIPAVTCENDVKTFFDWYQ